MTTRYSGDIAITPEGMAQSYARLHAERDRDPQLAAMAKAHATTKEERAQLDAADALVREAEQAVNAAGIALSRARRGMAPERGYDEKRPFTFFQKRPETYRAARESLPGMEADVSEARTHLTNAIRRRNSTERTVNVARAERRLAAKLKHAPKPTPVKSQADRWYSRADA